MLCPHEGIKRRSFIFKREYFFFSEKISKDRRSEDASLLASGWIFVCPTTVSTDAYCDRASRCSRHGCFTRTFQVPSSSFSSSFEVSFEADVRVETRRNVTSSYKRIYTALLQHLHVYQSLFPTKLLAKTR